MARVETWFAQDLNQAVKVRYIEGNVFSQDNNGNVVGVEVFNNGAAATLAGTVSGTVIRADGATVALTGSRTSNKCSVVLPQAAYAVPGVISIVIKLTNGDDVTTLCAVVGNVYQSSTDSAVDPGTIIPDIASLIASIDAAVDSIPLDYSALSDGFRDSMETAFGLSDPGTFSLGTIVKSTGNIATSTVYSVSDYIPVTGETILYTTSPATNSTVLTDRAWIAFYANNTSYTSIISYEAFEQGDPATLIWNTSKAPDSAKYMRICIAATLTDQFKCIQISPVATQADLDVLENVAYKQKFVLADNSNLDDLLDNKVYFVQSGASHIPTGYPSEFGNSAGMIMTSRMLNSDQRFGNQIAIKIPDGRMMFRSKSTTWRAWTDISAANATIVKQNITSFGGSGDAYASLADLPENTFFRTYNAPDRPDGQGATAGFWVMTLKAEDTNYWVQVGFGASTGISAMRHRASASGDYSSWIFISGQKKQLRVLCIGNSYTQDNMSYVPFIMKRIAPDINLTLGMSYYSGARIDQYIDFFDNDTRVLMYSKMTSADSSWTTWGTNTTTPGPNQKTIKEILSDEPWDIITIQQGSAYMASWQSFSNLNGWIDRIVTYERSLGLRHIRIGWLMPQMRKPQEFVSPDTYTYANMIDCVEKVIQTSPCSFVIPCGTAIENARHTSLDDLGAYSSDAPDGEGHLCYDTNGHLQEGIPCLVGAYAATLKLLELAGQPYIGILAENTYPNDTWLSGKNIPIAHGSAVGMSTSNCYLAQKCAVAANKFPYEVTEVE